MDNMMTLAEAIAKYTKMEVEARNRVDISLAEYESMKEQIRKLEDENASFKRVLDKLHFPVHAIDRVKPDTVKVLCSENEGDPLKPSSLKYRIEFDVEQDWGR